MMTEDSSSSAEMTIDQMNMDDDTFQSRIIFIVIQLTETGHDGPSTHRGGGLGAILLIHSYSFWVLSHCINCPQFEQLNHHFMFHV